MEAVPILSYVRFLMWKIVWVLMNFRGTEKRVMGINQGTVLRLTGIK